ncbi:zinc finger protein 830 [Octodon degus]|uniref:Zinc finger protein 830 n=1 Tax=Octodon degus TaxID=10160 RepID=A0A6P3VBI5_OCTDE|nr:zinc finger protein 830 [Octodon degus]
MASSTSAQTPAGKRVVNQEELRRLMKEKQRQSTNRKKVESPFAKYNPLGQLSCALCNTPVKSELLWQTHVLGKQHREKVAELKGAKGGTPAPAAGAALQSTKRKAPDTDNPDAKRAKPPQVQPSTSSTTLDKTGKESARATPSKLSGLGLLPDYEDEEEEEEEEEEGEGKLGGGSKQLPDPPSKEHSLCSSRDATSSVLPNDSFNTNPPKAPLVPHSGSIEKAEIHEKVRSPTWPHVASGRRGMRVAPPPAAAPARCRLLKDPYLKRQALQLPRRLAACALLVRRPALSAGAWESPGAHPP